MKVKELKEFLETLPKEAENNDVVFGSKHLDGLYSVDGAMESYFQHEDVPDGFTENFVLVWNGERP